MVKIYIINRVWRTKSTLAKCSCTSWSDPSVSRATFSAANCIEIWCFSLLRMLASFFSVSSHVFRLCPQICILKKKKKNICTFLMCATYSMCIEDCTCTTHSTWIKYHTCGTRCRIVSLLFPPAKLVNNERHKQFLVPPFFLPFCQTIAFVKWPFLTLFRIVSLFAHVIFFSQFLFLFA